MAASIGFVDYANENYVRLYTRDTVRWTLLSWEGQALLPQLLRKVDRAGRMDLPEGVSPAEAIAATLGRWPPEVVEAGLRSLTAGAEPSVILRDSHLLIPNFIEAQETPSSDRQRAKRSRERRRAEALGTENVTKRDADVTERDGSVTKRDATVTPRHTVSPYATLRNATQHNAKSELSLSDNRASPPARAARARRPCGMSADEEAKVQQVLDALSELRGTRRRTPGKTNSPKILALLREGVDVEELCDGLRARKWDAERQRDVEEQNRRLDWLNATTPFVRWETTLTLIDAMRRQKTNGQSAAQFVIDREGNYVKIEKHRRVILGPPEGGELVDTYKAKGAVFEREVSK